MVQADGQQPFRLCPKVIPGGNAQGRKTFTELPYVSVLVLGAIPALPTVHGEFEKFSVSLNFFQLLNRASTQNK